jgi:hypothetical protein
VKKDLVVVKPFDLNRLFEPTFAVLPGHWFAPVVTLTPFVDQAIPSLKDNGSISIWGVNPKRPPGVFCIQVCAAMNGH